MIPDAWSAGNAAGKYAGQPLKANCASHAEGLAPLLCALSSASRVYLSQGLSTRLCLFVDRCHNLVLASTEIPVFMDKTAQLTILSTITALFMDSPRFRWREYGQQATRLANTPASRSKQTARATPKGSLCLLCAPSRISTLSDLSPSNKPQRSHAYPHARREDCPQSRKAGK